jgi:pimeloyl-ACP methyl ester carboxylesterase
VATFVLIHGGGGSSSDWHLVAPALRERGHSPVAVDLPSEDECAGWKEYVDTVVRAIGSRTDVIVVGHSLGGFTAPLVCARIPVELLILLAAMIPAPGERFSDWWANANYEESGADDAFYHDVPMPLAAEARLRARAEASKALEEAWPRALARHPDEVPPLQRRPHVSRSLGAQPCTRASRHRGGRDRRGPLHRTQPAA